MKTEHLVESIKDRLDIVEVLSDYLELKRAGQNFKGLCPFHAEKTPSLMVSPEKQIFHCFGCGAGGNVFTFIMKRENLSFHEALKLLGKRAGVDVKHYRGLAETEQAKERLIAVQEAAMQVFAESLRKSKRAAAYLSDRGITAETIGLFSLGYAVKDWQHLTQLLRKKGFSDTLILQSGVASSKEGRLYDTFRDRIMFPIHSLQGDVCAFGGRVLDTGEPKYLNSADSPLFRKGETLYGLHRAKEHIRKTGTVLITEGYFDVLMCHQHGFGHAVAPLGTALTAGHLSKVKRFTKNIVLVFDGDNAGTAAAQRSAAAALEQGCVPRVVLLPEGDDPDSFLRQKGGQHFAQRLVDAKTALEFLFSITKKDKAETVREAIDIIAGAQDMLTRERLIGDLAEQAGMREAVIREELKRLQKKRGESDHVAPEGMPIHSAPLVYNEELLLLSMVVTFPDRLREILAAVPVAAFSNSIVRGVFEKLEVTGQDIGTLLLSLSDDEKELITRLTLNPGFDREHVDKNIEDCLHTIRMKELGGRLKQAEHAGDLKLLNALMHERKKLIKKGGNKNHEAV